MDNRPVLILADRKGKAWSFANEVYEGLSHNRRSKRKYILEEVEISQFPDREAFVKIGDNVREHECYFIHDSSMEPQNWAWTLLEANDALMRASAGKVNNVLPYMRYSRQDRLTEGRTPITAKVLANALNHSYVHRVLTTDLHNPAITGFYDMPFENLKAYIVLVEHLKKYKDFLENCVIVPPDEGSGKRTKPYRKRLGKPMVLVDKIRDEKTNEIIEINVVGDVKGKNVLIVDDMIATGGTLCEAASILKNQGANAIFAAATHGVLCKDKNGVEARKKLEDSAIEKIVLTDSIPIMARGKIEVVTLAGLYEEAIHCITHGDSISRLYRNNS